jgi:hypothetical protein
MQIRTLAGPEFIAQSLGQRRGIDLGCGNARCKMLSQKALRWLALTFRSGPQPTIWGECTVGSDRDDLYPFPLVIEVIEHCMEPGLAKTSLRARCFWRVWLHLTPITVPRNVALAVAETWIATSQPFGMAATSSSFQLKTLSALMREAGARDLKFVRVGRLPPL